MIKNILKRFIIVFFYLFLPFSFSVILFFFEKNYFNLENKKESRYFTIYDKNNNIIKNYTEKAEYKKIPKHLINAFIALEDTDFFNHYGFSIKSIIRSFVQNIKRGAFAQGGSTITQQYIKLYNEDLKKTLTRKLKELFIAIILELCYTKEEIFQAYCNILYFGKNIIGIAECARVLFNKNYFDLSLAESAMIAGIVQRPEYFNPIKNKEAAVKKKNLVLKRMLAENYISKKDYEIATNDQLKIFNNNFFNYNKSIYQTTEFDLIQLGLSSHHEYIILTSIDQNIQKTATTIFNEYISNFKKYHNEIEGTLIISNHKTGQIVSIINGYNLQKNNIRVFNWKKQIGSIIKPYIMYYALINGDTINTMYDDSPLEENFKWNPHNHNKKFSGKLSISDALIQSNNIVPIRILFKHGINSFISLIQPFFEHKISSYYSLSLGCIESSAFEMINLFNTLINNGKQKKLTYIEKIIKKSGGIIYENQKNKKQEYFSNSEIISIKEILLKIGNHLIKKNNINIKEPIYAKTGTTNDAISCWFVCANDTYSIVICIGTDNNIKLSEYNIRSSNSAAIIGLKILEKLTQLRQKAK